MMQPDSPAPRRTYTLSEIDRMRAVLNTQVTNEFFTAGDMLGTAERAKIVELRLQTYMSAGITPKELEAKAK